MSKKWSNPKGKSKTKKQKQYKCKKCGKKTPYGFVTCNSCFMKMYNKAIKKEKGEK